MIHTSCWCCLVCQQCRGVHVTAPCSPVQLVHLLFIRTRTATTISTTTVPATVASATIIDTGAVGAVGTAEAAGVAWISTRVWWMCCGGVSHVVTEDGGDIDMGSPLEYSPSNHWLSLQGSSVHSRAPSSRTCRLLTLALRGTSTPFHSSRSLLN